MIVPSTRVDVLRSDPGAVDEYGDPTDTDTVIAESLLCDLAETSQRVYDAARSEMVMVEQWTARFAPNVAFDFRETDRLREAEDGRIFQVDRVHRSRGIVRGVLRLDCTRVTP